MAVVHVVWTVGTLGIEVTVVAVTLGAFEAGEGHAIRANLIVVAMGTVVTTHHTLQALGLAVAALAASLGARAHSHNPLLGSGQKTTNTGDKELLEALGLAVALLPGETVGRRGGLLDLGLGDVQLAGGVLDKGNGDGVDRNGVSLQVENGESDIEKVGAGLVGRGCYGHDLEGVANGHRASNVAIFELLEDVDWARRDRREDLATVGQQAVVFNGQVEHL
jgi:hypothetical protein